MLILRILGNTAEEYLSAVWKSSGHSDNPNSLQRTNSLASTFPLSTPSYMTLVGWFGPSTSSRLLRIIGRACMVVVLCMSGVSPLHILCGNFRVAIVHVS